MKTAAQISGFEIEKYAKKSKLGFVREGFYIHLQDTEEHKSTGEVAPLPGRSMETLDEAYQNLLQLRKNFLNNQLDPLPLYPSVMFGMQMALYCLQEPRKALPLQKTTLYLKPPLFPTSGPVKIKLGHLPVDQAVLFYQKMARKEKNVRIDLERKWELEKTLEFCTRIDSSYLLYIEDPTTNYSDLETFAQKTGIPFAVDAFLPFQPPERIKKLRGLHSIVVKPSLVGGIHECRSLQQAFDPIPLSFSSLFETKVGIDHIQLIASMLAPDAPVGIDTLKFL